MIKQQWQDMQSDGNCVDSSCLQSTQVAVLLGARSCAVHVARLQQLQPGLQHRRSNRRVQLAGSHACRCERS